MRMNVYIINPTKSPIKIISFFERYLDLDLPPCRKEESLRKKRTPRKGLFVMFVILCNGRRTLTFGSLFLLTLSTY